MNGTELGEEAVGVAAEKAKSKPTVENQGESTEYGSTSPSRGCELQGIGPSIAFAPRTPTPSGEVTLEVKVDMVPGEQVSENDEASYTVVFE